MASRSARVKYLTYYNCPSTVKHRIILLLLASPLALLAQKQVSHQQTYWLRYQNQLYFTEKLSWINEIDNRRFFSPGIQNQLIVHTRINYLHKNVEPSVGCSFSWQYAQEPEKGYDVVVPEIRPFQEVTHHVRLAKKLKMTNRVRVDDRFIRHHSGGELTPGYDFLLRFRLRTQLAYTLREKYVFKASDEIMINDRNNTFDQNRVATSVEFLLAKKYSVELGYTHIYQQRSNNNGFFARDVLRLTFLHKFFLIKKDKPGDQKV